MDYMTAAVMMVDTELKIVYINPSATKLMKRIEKTMQESFPFFQADNLLGVCIDDFHKNPSHQRGLLSDPNNLPFQSVIEVGPLKMELNVTAVFDQDRKFLGACQEWRDVTEESSAEEHISQLVEAASSGDLSQRIDSSRYSGFMKSISEEINNLLEQIESPIQEVSKVMSGLDSGDLTQTMQGNYSGEFASLQTAVNSSMNNLKSMVTEIRISSTQIGSAAGEISTGNADLSQRTEEQASSLEETASSMEELTSTVRQNADNSKQANTLASGARKEAEAGGQVIDSTIVAMNAINEASTKIEDIISVIDEIAFQTNLLALNAAVEAARAGEQGRGFAVVASEVRSLAQRSAAAAKEIKVLIKDSVEKVDEGTRLVDESGSTLSAIVSSVKKVSDIIAEIAAASSEQSAGIDQVGKAITQLDEVTQQNAALVEEAAAASESMDEQAKSLNDRMSFFETGTGGEQSTPIVERPIQSASSPAKKVEPIVAKTTSQPVSGSDWEEF